MFKKHVLQRPKVQAKQQSYCCFVFAFSLVFCYSLTLSHKEHKELKHNLYCVCFFFLLKRKCKHWMENTHLSQAKRTSLSMFQCFLFHCFLYDHAAEQKRRNTLILECKIYSVKHCNCY